MKNKGNKMR